MRLVFANAKLERLANLGDMTMGIAVAEVFPPGEYLRDEIAERGWTQEEFAEIIGRSFKQVNELLSGKAALTAPMAHAIAAALGTSPEVWLGLENAYRLRQAQPASADIARRARLRSEFPVRELQRRGWIPRHDDIADLEQAVFAFYGINAVEERVELGYAAKRSSYRAPLTRTQEAILCRIRALATRVPAARYEAQKLHACLESFRALLHDPQEVRQVPRLLAEAGVRFVVCEPFPRSKLDGVCTWLDPNTPVIGMTLRLDRIDNFWFVLRHECEHILRGDGRDTGFIVDDELGSGQDVETAEMERLANAAAEQFLVPPGAIDEFLDRVGLQITKGGLVKFALSLQVHPGIVVGQLQRRLQRWDLFRPLQGKIRDAVTAAALTDGYGHLVA